MVLHVLKILAAHQLKIDVLDSAFFKLEYSYRTTNIVYRKPDSILEEGEGFILYCISFIYIFLKRSKQNRHNHLLACDHFLDISSNKHTINFKLSISFIKKKKSVNNTLHKCWTCIPATKSSGSASKYLLSIVL